MKLDGKKVVYKGLFFNGFIEELLREKVNEAGLVLDNWINNIHVTFEFKPETLFSGELMGKEFELKVIGLGSNGNVTGFFVELPEELQNEYMNKARPHITVSIAEGTSPKETGSIDFDYIDEFYISGKLGYFLGYKIKYTNF